MPHSDLHKLPSIPDIPNDVEGKQYMEPMKEIAEVLIGSRGRGERKTDAAVRWQDLVDVGLITADQIPKT